MRDSVADRRTEPEVQKKGLYFRERIEKGDGKWTKKQAQNLMY